MKGNEVLAEAAILGRNDGLEQPGGDAVDGHPALLDILAQEVGREHRGRPIRHGEPIDDDLGQQGQQEAERRQKETTQLAAALVGRLPGRRRDDRRPDRLGAGRRPGRRGRRADIA